MIVKQRVGVTAEQAQTQLAVFEGWIDAAIEGATKTDLLPSEPPDVDQLILALINKAGGYIAMMPDRNVRGVVLAQVGKRLRHLAEGGK